MTSVTENIVFWTDSNDEAIAYNYRHAPYMAREFNDLIRFFGSCGFSLGNLQFQSYNKLLMQILTHSNADKQPQMLELLKYGTVMAFVDSRHPDVVVPDYLKNDYQLRLNFDYAFQIDDFRILPDRLEASLSFNRKNFFCVIPFKAIYLLINQGIQRGSLFIESVPIEMLEIFANMEKQDSPKANKLYSLSNSGKEESSSPASVQTPSLDKQPASVNATANEPKEPLPSEKKDPKKRGHLRLVK